MEGKSAASTVRQAMNSQSQDVFALQGKVINAESASQARVEANAVCAALFATLGCGVGNQCDPSRLRYARIILLTDPDVDGAHSRGLLATLFARYLRELVRNDRVFAVTPPLWRVVYANDSRRHYAWTDQELKYLREKAMATPGAEKLSAPPPSSDVTRFSGVAQFSLAECAELLLDPDTRQQVRLSIGER